ncbi:T9SS type A sorting domain-containing protein [uncultured Flavobacterium sp.]|uniref:T9SS type A sorting domain-containing protein n=1 Tax=uncultured Flavobacterium sp. TaxID=165435 RepID=UPI003081FAAB
MKTKLLLLLLLANFSIFAQTNLVPNGSFEAWSSSSQPDHWNRFLSGYVSQSTTAQNGTSSTNMMIASGTFNYINTDYFAVEAGKKYRVTMYHKVVKGTFSSIDFSVYHKPGVFKEEIVKKSDVTFSTTEWRKIEFEYNSPTSENIEVDIWTNGSLDSEILVDNVSLVDVAEAPAQYTMIPDVNFEKKLIDLGIDSGAIDGKVLTSKINTLQSLNISNSSISDLSGIEDFSALYSLYCNNNNLTNLDLSKNLLLLNIDCSHNLLTSLTINKAGSNLNASANKLENVDFSQNTSLNFLDLTSNLLTTLDISQNENLGTLQVSYNKLTSLNLSKNKVLGYLKCLGNQLSTIDLSNNTTLEYLFITTNSLTTLDLSKNTKLRFVDCSSNKLTSLKTSSGASLQNLNCAYNKLTSLDLSANTGLTELEFQSNLIQTINVSASINLDFFNGSYNQLKTLDVSKNVNLTYFNCTGNILLSELNLKNGNNTKIKDTDFSIRETPSLYCLIVDDVAYSTANWTSNIDPYTIFTNAPCAPVKYTLIPDINFEKSLIKKGIDAVEDGKVLTSKIAIIKVLDLSDYYTNLKIEDLTGIADFTALEELTLPSYNSGVLKTIDISHNLALRKLTSYQTKLETLDVSNNLALTELNLYRNNLTTLNVSKNLELTKLDCSLNRLTSLDVTANKKLKSLACAASNEEGNYSPLQGLLTSLDLSQNLDLEVLDCSSNDKIVGLDVSKNLKLTSINVSNNKLTSIDFSANKLLKFISCESNQITSLDLSKYPALENLQCSFNQLTTLDVSQKPGLTFLACEYNQLTSIDVSKNPVLERLYCSGNKIASLDISANPNMKQLLCGSNNMTKLNLKNGNNTKFEIVYNSVFTNNPNLTCILVDDVDYSNKTWATFKDKTASYNTECSFSLPSKNFTVETKGESCVGENNGEISITATAEFSYTASVNGKTSTFTNKSLKVNNLAPGTYAVIVTIPGEVYEQTFNLTIAKAVTITGKSSITSKTVDVEITQGTAPFTVFVDGAKQFQTNDAAFSVNVDKNAVVEVTTAKACEGVFAKKVSVSDFESQILSAYPNPTSGSFEIQIPTNKTEVKIELYNFGGQLISGKTYTIENGKALLNLENQASGIYAVKVYLETPEYLKIIKK